MPHDPAIINTSAFYPNSKFNIGSEKLVSQLRLDNVFPKGPKIEQIIHIFCLFEW